MTAVTSLRVTDPLAPQTKENAVVNVTEVDVNDNDRFIVHSPYTDPEHLLDLETLDNENALLARALSHLECLRADYATADYVESFNWGDVMRELKTLVQTTGKSYKETSFYIVAFRSQIPPTTVYGDLGVLDKAAHAEANQVGDTGSGALMLKDETSQLAFGGPDQTLSRLAMVLLTAKRVVRLHPCTHSGGLIGTDW
ncbi:hypothetical protein K4K61_003125 [Colletotrichum sp. SAR11_59]|nr:hypothetical protein K4K61_003125 [Colletotrichum sp. SAR11_59]